MAALSPALAASQLFGHTRGAFTGADRASTGYFGEADGGTLFLDEIGATPSDVQALLLRAGDVRREPGFIARQRSMTDAARALVEPGGVPHPRATSSPVVSPLVCLRTGLRTGP